MVWIYYLKEYKISEGIKKQDHIIHCLQEIHLKCKDTDRLKNPKRWKKTYHSNTNERKAGLAGFLSDKAEFRSKKIIRENVRYYIITKGSILQDILLSLMGMHQKTQRQHTWGKHGWDKYTIIMKRVQHTSLNYWQLSQKIINGIIKLDSTISEEGLHDIFRKHNDKRKHIFFFQVHKEHTSRRATFCAIKHRLI